MLKDPRTLEQQVKRMVADPQSRWFIANFFGGGKKAAKEDALEREDVKVEKDFDAGLRENNSPLPKSPVAGVKRGRSEAERDAGSQPITPKAPKLSSDQNRSSASPTKSLRKSRSATSNATMPKSSPSKAAQGTQKITKFFGK